MVIKDWSEVHSKDFFRKFGEMEITTLFISRQHNMKTYPNYIKLKSFVVPLPLLDYIQGLTTEEQRNFCFIVSTIITHTKKQPTRFVEINRVVWLNYVGSEYPNYLHKLQVWNIIEVDHSYLPKKECKNDNYFCKSFRLHKNVLTNPTTILEFEKKVVQPLKDKSDKTDPILTFVFNNLMRLDVSQTLLEPESNVEKVECREGANKVYWKVFNVHYGERVSRIFHSVIQMASVARRNIFLKEDPTTPLYEYDIRSCHPVLMLKMIADPKEREEYVRLLDDDIYSVVAKECGVMKDRDTIKNDFMCFVNGTIRNYFYQYFKTHFPNLLIEIVRNGKAMASISQNSEAEIMVNHVPTKLQGIDPNILYVSMHDGWIGTEKDESIICQIVSDLFYSITGGYKVTITKTPLGTDDKMVCWK